MTIDLFLLFYWGFKPSKIFYDPSTYPFLPSVIGLSRYLAVLTVDPCWMLNTLFSLLARVKTK